MNKKYTSKSIYPESYQGYSYDMFLSGTDNVLSEINEFNKWLEYTKKKDIYTFEAERLTEQRETVELATLSGKNKKLINFASYNYLGFGYHPKVKNAAKRAIDVYGTGAASSPVSGGTFAIHKELERKLIEFMGLGRNYGVSLFSTGYGANVGAISSCMHPGSYVILDCASHVSIMEGARLSGATIRVFKHNDVKDLERVLISIKDESVRKLICCESVYSVDGDRGNISGIVNLAKKYNAFTLVDEAHSMMVAGDHGRGVCEEQGVSREVDMTVVTFSKAFCSLGGAVIANKKITNYINLYARCRMFSVALPPSVTGSVIKVIELGMSKDGYKRRKALVDNAKYMRFLLNEKVDTLDSDTWIIPVLYKDEKISMELSKYLHSSGVDAGCLFFPVVPRGKARIRLFISSAHTKKHLKQAAEIILKAAKKFDFLKK